MESETGQDPRGAPAKPRANKSAIWEIFEDMRYELKATKSGIDSDVKQAKEQKQEMESRLASLCFSKEGERRWRMIQKSLDFWIVLGKCQARSRLYGSQLYKQTDSDKKIYETITKIQVEEDQKGKQRNSFILYPGSIFLKVWAALLLALLVYTVITVPLSIGFLDYQELKGFTYFDWFIDGIFLADIFINLRTAQSEDRDSPMMILCDYAQSWLFIDVIAVIPFDIFFDDGTYGFRLITKIPRFFRVVRIFKVLKVNGNFKKNPYLKKLNEVMNLSPAMKTLLSFMLTMFVIIHISGCIWYFLAKMYDFGPGTWVFE